jgi:hypothetical protein
MIEPGLTLTKDRRAVIVLNDVIIVITFFSEIKMLGRGF